MTSGRRLLIDVCSALWVNRNGVVMLEGIIDYPSITQMLLSNCLDKRKTEEKFYENRPLCHRSPSTRSFDRVNFSSCGNCQTESISGRTKKILIILVKSNNGRGKFGRDGGRRRVAFFQWRFAEILNMGDCVCVRPRFFFLLFHVAPGRVGS